MTSFTFYETYYETLKKIRKPQDRMTLMLAIVEFVFDGKEPEDLSEGAEIAFESFRKTLEKSRNNGGRGGRKSKNRIETELKPIDNRLETELKPNCDNIQNRLQNGFSKEENPLIQEKRSKKENITQKQENITPFFISPTGDKKNDSADKFFSLYPRYAKDRAKMRVDVDYDKLLDEFEKSSYLRSLYTVKQINENYPLIVNGDFRDKEKTVDGVTAGRELLADRERWYTAKKNKAEGEAEKIYNTFMKDETFKGIEKRLRELVPEMARLEVDAEKGVLKAKQKLVKLTQEEGRLRLQRVSIIERNGMSEEDLLPKWSCRKCRDTGYQEDGKMCDCYGG